MGKEAYEENPAPAGAIKALRELAPDLPSSYFEFLTGRNGGEAPIPVDPWTCIFWPAHEVAEFNTKFSEDIPPGFFVFGGSGGGDALAFKLDAPQKGSIWQFPRIGWSDNTILVVAKDFDALVEMAGEEGEEPDKWEM